jgi:signal transduction histidine kinase/AmiR/NasT family two-component response regulator
MIQPSPRDDGRVLVRKANDGGVSPPREERPLQESLRLLESVFRAIPDVLFVVDRELRVVMSNQGDPAGRIIDPTEIRPFCHNARGLFDQCPENRGKACQSCPVRNVFQTKEVCRAELASAHDGRTRAVCGSPVFDDAGDVTLVVVHVRDITDEKRDQQEIKHYAAALESANKALEEFCQAAEAATRAKSEFLANMSHEIRTPMTAILGYAENLLAPELVELDRIDAVQTIRRNGEHLLTILNDILDLSKIEAGKLHVERIACSPAQVVADVKTLMQDPAKQKALAFEVAYQGPIPKVIQSDPTRLRQILINLVGNAIKFTTRGAVRLIVSMARGETEPMLAFEVTDSGIGMSADEVARLFRPFSQADSSTTRKFGGTGLGLAISRRLVERLGGRITVESRPGEGSTFRVLVATGMDDKLELVDHPDVTARDESVSAAQASNEDLASLAGRRVLVAEDAPDNQRLICIILKKAGVEVSLAENGRVARDAAMESLTSGKPFDVVLMDMQMPELDGYEATQQLRAGGYTGPIVALTAHAVGPQCERCREVGCDAYATKPISRAALLGIVSEYARRGPRRAHSDVSARKS